MRMVDVIGIKNFEEFARLEGVSVVILNLFMMGLKVGLAWRTPQTHAFH